MRPQTQGLTTAEWYLMEALWEHSPKTAREVIEDMKLRQGWNRSTTLTMLRRHQGADPVHREAAENGGPGAGGLRDCCGRHLHRSKGGSCTYGAVGDYRTRDHCAHQAGSVEQPSLDSGRRGVHAL